MTKPILATAATAVALALAACGGAQEDNVAIENVEELNATGDLNMDMDMNMNADMNFDVNATDMNATDNATGNEALDGTTNSY
ncbi:MAG TPA: circumsporozoite protein [Sphingomicrobium sp.]|nr:circumsporozoite protein [Sphingomicrobium sp.]